MRWSHGLGICMIFALFACGAGENGGGCGSDYEYPQTLEAEPTDKAIQARVTQQGIDVFAASVPGFLADNCVGDLAEQCFLEPCDGTDPDWLNFIIEESDGTGYELESEAPLQAGESYTGECGPAYSSMGFELETLSQGMSVDVFDDSVKGAGVKVTLSDVNLKFDAKIEVLGMNCNFDPSDTNLILESLIFRFFPKVELIDGHAILAVDEDDIIVDSFDLDTSQLDGGCLISFIASALIPLFEDLVVTILADALVNEFGGEALEASGELDLNEFISMPNPAGNPVGYLLRANEDSPTVTGPDDYNEGMNFDIDAGFAGEHSHCVGVIEPPSFSLPAVPEITNSIEQPHPETGQMTMDVFHVAALVGDVTFTRALYELFDSGAFCMRLKAETLGELSGGIFVPSVSTIALLAPGALNVAAADAPVDIAMLPGLPAVIKYGTGEGEGESRDSHFQLIWPEFSVRLYTYVDDALIQFLGIGMDLDFGLSFEVSAGGDLEFQIDRIKIENVHAVYNEMNLDFDPEGVGELVELFLPTLLNEAPLNLELSAAALGLPYVPKARAVERMGDEGRYLGFFFKLCTPDQINDTNDALCYEDLSSDSAGNSLHGINFRVEEAPEQEDGFWVEIESPEIPAVDLEASYRLAGESMWRSFRAVDSVGRLSVTHPGLHFPGIHELVFRIRDRQQPGLWSEEKTIQVSIDKLAPTLRAWRSGNQIHWQVEDDVTRSERIRIKAEINHAGASSILDFEHRQSLEVNPQAQVTLWAMDDRGRISKAYFLDGQVQESAQTGVADVGGCQSTGSTSVVCSVLMLLTLFGFRRNTRKRSTL